MLLEERTLADLVLDRPLRARVLLRYGLDYICGGDRSLQQACTEAGADPSGVLADLEFLDAAPGETEGWVLAAEGDLGSLVDHLVAEHHAPVRRVLTRLGDRAGRLAVEQADDHPELVDVQRVLAELGRELVAHLEEEERQLFPKIRALGSRESARPPGGEALQADFRRAEEEHRRSCQRLGELRHLTRGFWPPARAGGEYRALLDDLRDLEARLQRQFHLENNVLFPAVRGGREPALAEG